MKRKIHEHKNSLTSFHFYTFLILTNKSERFFNDFFFLSGSGGILQAALKLGGRRVRGIETLPEWAKLANEAISSTSRTGSGSRGGSGSGNVNTATPVVNRSQ